MQHMCNRVVALHLPRHTQRAGKTIKIYDKLNYNNFQERKLTVVEAGPDQRER